MAPKAKQAARRAKGLCFDTAVALFQRLVGDGNEESLYFVSLMAPCADTGAIGELFVVEQDGVVLDPRCLMIWEPNSTRARVETGQMPKDEYYEGLEASAERMGIAPYRHDALRLNTKQFLLYTDIVGMSIFRQYAHTRGGLAMWRECVRKLLDVWDEAVSETRIASLVLTQVLGERVELQEVDDAADADRAMS